MQNDQATNDAQAQIQELLDIANQIGQEVDQFKRNTQEGMDQIKAEIKQTVNEIEAVTAELDTAEAESTRQLDDLLQAYSLKPAQA